jgi:hypothetical protein
MAHRKYAYSEFIICSPDLARLRRLPEELVRVRPKMRTLCTSGCTEDAIILRGVLKPGVSYLPKSSSRMPWLRKVREMPAR